MKPLKSLALSLLFVVGGGVLSAEAQDIITTKDAEEITAKVQAITPQGITYLKWDNLDGPTYFIDTSDVLFIKYQNGTKEVFTAQQSDAKKASAKAGTGGGLTASGIKFQSDISLGTIFGADYAGPTLDIALGARIGRYFFIGAQTGLRSIIETVDLLYYGYGDLVREESKTLFEGYIPLELNMKGYIPVSEKVRPYINCSLGGFFGVADLDGLNGFSCQVGAGVEINRVSIGIGYNGLVKYGTSNLGYIKIGIRLGKN